MQKAKKPSKAEESVRARRRLVAIAVLEQIATHGADGLNLPKLAKKCKCTDAQIRAFLPDSTALPLLIAQWVDEETEAQWPNLQQEGLDAKDRLFDLLMLRIDCLDQHKKAFLRLSLHIRKSPALAAPFFKAQKGSMKRILRHAGMAPNSLSTLLMLGFYHATLLKWEADSPTATESAMARLDSLLTKAISVFK